MHEAKTAKNQQLLDILAYNSANKPSFKNVTKGVCPLVERWSIR